MVDPHLMQSPLLLGREDSALLVIDVQEKLLPAVRDSDALQGNIARLIRGARILGIPIHATEQYPQGLGTTVPEISEALGDTVIPEKLAFSAAGCDGLFATFADSGVHKLVICGIEAHVCVLQTALDAITEGYQAHIVCDAVSSRHPQDADIAIRRMETSGVYVTTTETVLFEWCRTAGTPEFKEISRLVKTR